MEKEELYLLGVLKESKEYLKRKTQVISEKGLSKFDQRLEELLLPSLKEIILSKVFADIPKSLKDCLRLEYIIASVNAHFNQIEKYEYLRK